MCAEQSLVGLTGERVKPQVPSVETISRFKRVFAVANPTASRVTEALEHWVSKETGRNAKAEMLSVNGSIGEIKRVFRLPGEYETRLLVGLQLKFLGFSGADQGFGMVGAW